jgi:hypothetical protein
MHFFNQYAACADLKDSRIQMIDGEKNLKERIILLIDNYYCLKNSIKT